MKGEASAGSVNTEGSGAVSFAINVEIMKWGCDCFQY